MRNRVITAIPAQLGWRALLPEFDDAGHIKVITLNVVAWSVDNYPRDPDEVDDDVREYISFMSPICIPDEVYVPSREYMVLRSPEGYLSIVHSGPLRDMNEVLEIWKSDREIDERRKRGSTGEKQ